MSGKVPPSSRAGKHASGSSQVRRAANLYERFSGHEAEECGRVNLKPIPPVMIAVGTLDAIEYTTVRDDVREKYRHVFAAKDRPIFAVSPDGKQIFLIGGGYDFTERGIVDKSDIKTRAQMRKR